VHLRCPVEFAPCVPKSHVKNSGHADQEFERSIDARRSSPRRDHQPVHPLNRCRASRIVVLAESSRLVPQAGPSTSHDREPYSPMLGQPRSSGRRGGVCRARVGRLTGGWTSRLPCPALAVLARAARIEDHKSLAGCPSGRGGAAHPRPEPPGSSGGTSPNAPPAPKLLEAAIHWLRALGAPHLLMEPGFFRHATGPVL